MDWGKYLYETQKQQKKQSKSHHSSLKEIRISLKIGLNDLKIKAKRAAEFIQDGDSVKLNLRLKGREGMFVNNAIALMENFKELSGGEFVDPPKKLGNQLNCIITKRKENAQAQNQ
jgi:translation initiation factor IF-3